MPGNQRVNIDIHARNKTARAFKSVNQGLGSLRKGAFAVQGALAAVAGTAGLGAVAKQAIESADKMGKTADKLGITTDALQEFRYAAEQSGVSTDTFDMAMQRFTRRTAEAASGTGEAKAALEELGISLQDSQGNLKTSDALLMDVAGAMQSVKTDGDKLRIAFKLFDSEGAALVNMLGDGEQGLQQFRDMAQQTGAVMEEDLIRNATELNNRYNAIAATISTTFKSAVVEVADTIAKLGEIQGQEYKGTSLEQDMETRKQLLQRYTAELIEFESTYQQRLQGILASRETIGQENANRAIQALAAEYNRLRDQVEKAGGAIKKTSGEIKAQKPLIQEVTEQTDAWDIALDLIEKQFADLDKQNAKVIAGFKTFEEKGAEVSKTMAQNWNDSVTSMKDSTSDAITDMMMGMSSLGDTVKSISAMIVRSFIKKQFADPAADELGELFSFHGGGFTGAGSRSGGVDGRGGFPAILHPNETVVDHTRGQSTGGGTVIVNYSPQVNALDPRTAATVIAQNAPTVVGIIEQSLNRRGRTAFA